MTAPRKRARPGLRLPLLTDRLQIREFGAADLDALASFSSDPEVTRHLLYAPRDREATRRHLLAVIRMQQDPDRSAWELAVTSRANGELVGACDLTRVSAEELDIGYVFARPQWGQGYATELTRAIVEVAFTQFRMQRVRATVALGNERSAAVLEKAGLRWEAVLRRHVRARGKWWDVQLYGLIREDWELQQQPDALADPTQGTASSG